MANVTIKLTGFKELEAKLKAFGPEVAKNGLRTSTFAGARIIRDAARRNVPVDTGLLKGQIIASRRRTPENVAKYTILVKKKAKFTKIRKLGRNSKRPGKYTTAAPPTVYGKFLEFGTSRMKAKPWLRPAFFNNTTETIEAIRGGLAKAITRAAKK